MFKNPFSFEGRIRRTEYGLSFLFFYFVIGCVAFLGEEFIPNEDMRSMVLFIIILPGFWFLFAQAAKRCHDKNLSGWFQFIPFFRYVLVFLPSDYGPNRFGPNPKGEGNPDDLADFGKELVGT